MRIDRATVTKTRSRKNGRRGGSGCGSHLVRGSALVSGWTSPRCFDLLPFLTRQYRPWTPDQSWLLPPSPRDWLDKEQFVYFFFGMEVVDELDISAIEDTIQAKDARGTAHNRLKLWRHGAVGV